jgi:hypothetical protein
MPTRYTIIAHGQPRRKSALRMLMRLAGLESVRIAEEEAEASKPKVKPDNVPTTPEARLVCDLFKRRHETPWSEAEIRAFREAVKTGLTVETMGEVAAFYKAERKKESHYCRREILTFLRHYAGEVDKARASKPQGKANSWAPAENVVPMISEEEAERVRLAALDEMRKFKEAHGR